MTDSHDGKKDKPKPPKPPKPHVFHIRIDRTEYEVREESRTGAELRQLPDPDIGPDRDLFEVVPGGSDRKIELDTVVTMRDGLRFFTAPAQINPGQRRARCCRRSTRTS